MKVADLAAELEVPTSTILDQCQRFGIDAAWAGAELEGADVIVLRAELAAAEPIDLRDEPAAPAAAPGPAAQPDAADEPAAASPPATPPADAAPTPADAPAALPPTAVGSMPELIDDVTPEPEPAPSSRAPGFAMAGDQGVAQTATQRAQPKTAPTTRRLDRYVRTSILSLVVAIAAFAGSNFVDLAAVVALLWLIAAVCLCVAVVDGIRGRRHVQTHPERFSGLWPATLVIVFAVAGIIGLTVSVAGVVGDEPAVDAPMGVGKLDSVQTARWGYHRLKRFEDNGWKQPAREEGSCWEVDKDEQRDVDRVEEPTNSDQTRCDRKHTLEVAKVFAFNRDADAPYPTTDQFTKAKEAECDPIADRLTAKGVQAVFVMEVPSERGWSKGDHDVACVLITPERTSPLAS